MVNQSVIDSSVNLEQLKDIEDLIPDMDKAISEKVETFLDKSGDQPYAHMNEGYVVIVEMTGEMDATDAISDIVNIGLHFILKNVRPYAAPCSEA